MNILNNKKIILALTLLSTSMSFGVDYTATSTMVGQIYTLITYIATAMGLGLMILGGVKMKKRADNPNDVKTFPMSIVVTFLVGAMMFNFSQTSNTFIKTFLGDSANYCMIALETQVAGEIPKEGCWDASQSEALNEVIAKANSMNDANTTEQIRNNAKLFFMVFQTLGFVFFLKGLYTLKLASEGTQNKTYGEAFTLIFFSTLAINLPNTIELVQSTLETIGFSF
ncbi:MULTISPECIES: hypothetical protein [unclassified Vibrio]|uniref:hypothetical protein n=1 Tax=unclassified Vibrio TaxID=2614977 RepID=UPI000C838F17|nr:MULTISPECIES: hypothetical protein [unclassified Vibrio]PMK76855.1 hypothetical protein BCT92_22015 [Vibrio sp. 10N.261.52.E5]TKF76370.1 hypothetical protein FCV65_24690 [Vibrio sp. F13]